MFIDKVLSDPADVLIFTRPRRFGKSINLTMLDAFLNMERSGNTWFEGTAIDGIRKYDRIRNTVPILYMDLKSVVPISCVGPMVAFGSILRRTYRQHRYLMDSDRLDEDERDHVRKVINREATDFTDLDEFRCLTELVHKHTGTRPFVLIDEYDAPVNNHLDTDSYRNNLMIARSMLSGLLKGNRDLGKAVLMGITPMAHESLMSGLNNANVNDVFEPGEYADCFGMTESEVTEVCREAGLEGMSEKVREYYDGYVIGGTHMFNPYSVMRFVDSGKLEPHWTRTGTNIVLENLLRRTDYDMRDSIFSLMSGGTMVRSRQRSIGYPPSGKIGDMDPDAATWLMTQTGYLTSTDVGDDKAEYVIPNDEVRSAFTDDVRGWIGVRLNTAETLVQQVLDGKPEDVGDTIRELVANMKGNARIHENLYQFFVAGALTAQSTHDVIPEFYSGFGVTDVTMIPHGKGDAVVAEFKVVRKGGDPEAVADEAFAQIRNRCYAKWVRGDDALLYGIAVGRGGTAVRFERLRRVT